MSRRGQPCDCCGAPRLRWQRLCAACWRALPGSLRTPLIEAFKRGDKPAWRAARSAARAFLADDANAHVRACSASTTPQQVYARAQAMIGERE